MVITLAGGPPNPRDLIGEIWIWCGRGDSNPHALASASPSSWCVCQFRHFRKYEGCDAVHFGGCAGAEDVGALEGEGVPGVVAGAPEVVGAVCVAPPVAGVAGALPLFIGATGTDAGFAAPGVPLSSEPELPR